MTEYEWIKLVHGPRSGEEMEVAKGVEFVTLPDLDALVDSYPTLDDSGAEPCKSSLPELLYVRPWPDDKFMVWKDQEGAA